MINDTKEKILKAADSLFFKYGIRSVSMDDISKEISVSKKTIYQYFKDKDELVTLISQSHIDQERTEFTEIIKTADNAIDELFKISSCLRNHIKQINPSVLFDIQKFHPNSWNLWLEYKNVFIKNTILNVIARGKEEGFFRANLDAEIMATFRVESVEMTFNDKLFPTDKFDFMEVQMTVFDHFVHGLMTVKGLELYDSLIHAKTYESK